MRTNSFRALVAIVLIGVTYFGVTRFFKWDARQQAARLKEEASFRGADVGKPPGDAASDSSPAETGDQEQAGTGPVRLSIPAPVPPRE